MKTAVYLIQRPSFAKRSIYRFLRGIFLTSFFLMFLISVVSIVIFS